MKIITKNYNKATHINNKKGKTGIFKRMYKRRNRHRIKQLIREGEWDIVEQEAVVQPLTNWDID